MNPNSTERYRFPKTLSEQCRMIGLPIDEFLPVILPVIWGFLTRNYLFSLLVAAALWQLVKTAKRGKSSCWLYNWCYWHLPAELFRVIYRVIPDSSFRQWIR